MKAADGEFHEMVAARAALPALLFSEGEDGLVEGGVAGKRGVCLLLAAPACSGVTLRTPQSYGFGCDGAEEGGARRAVAVYTIWGAEFARFGLEFQRESNVQEGSNGIEDEGLLAATWGEQ